MEYYNGRLCVSMRELVANGIMTVANYKQMARRGRLEIARQGRGPGIYALVVVDSLPEKYQDQVSLKIGLAELVPIIDWIRKNYKRDQNAVIWFHDSHNTQFHLSAAKIDECIATASMLNCCSRLFNSKNIGKIMGESCLWQKIARAVGCLSEQFGHKLPVTRSNFIRKYNEYCSFGYKSLISGRYGNQNARKME